MYKKNDERLVPFVGGLIVGGIGGAAFDGFNKNNFQNPGYGYPGYSYPVYYYPSQYPTYYASSPNPQVNIYNPYISSADDATKIVNTETPLIYQRNDYITKDVPAYQKYYK